MGSKSHLQEVSGAGTTESQLGGFCDSEDIYTWYRFKLNKNVQCNFATQDATESQFCDLKVAEIWRIYSPTIIGFFAERDLHFCGSFSAKEHYNWWFFCGERYAS